MPEKLEALDIFLTRGSGWLSKLIRKMTRARGEEPTVVNHVGIIMRHGLGLNAWGVEALPSGVKFHQLLGYQGGKTTVYVFRPVNLTEEQKDIIYQSVLDFVNRPYGWGKLLLHAADHYLGGRYIFRRLGRLKDVPICSFVIARAFKEAGLDFGVAAEAASPDDIWDFVTTHPDKYWFVWKKPENT